MPRIRVLPLVVAVSVVAAGSSVALADEAGKDPTIRVRTFNIRYSTAPDGDDSWNNRKELLLDVIRKFNPDLLGTQEVLASQADFLSGQLEGYTLVGVGGPNKNPTATLSKVEEGCGRRP